LFCGDGTKFNFNVRTDLRFGAGLASELGKSLKEIGIKRAGVIIDSNIYNLDFVKSAISHVERELEFVKIWMYDLGAEPDYDSLDRIKALFLNDKSEPTVDCFVGIGGGSVIDFAKGLATVLVNPGKAITYRGFPTNIVPSLPTIAVPTTAGTGSEVTYNAVFIDKDGKKKLGINTKHNFPVLAILDPKLTVSCPKSVTAASGIDAMIHAIEAYSSVNSDRLTRIFAVGAVSLMYNNLSKVFDAPTDLEVRGNLQLGAYLGGLCLINSGGGPTGALSYVLGANFNVPHGLAGAVFLPHIIEHNLARGYDYSELLDAILASNASADSSEKGRMFLKKIKELYAKLNIPTDLKPFGIDKNNINVLLKEVENYGGAFSKNPVTFSVDDAKKLLLRMIA